LKKNYNETVPFEPWESVFDNGDIVRLAAAGCKQNLLSMTKGFSQLLSCRCANPQGSDLDPLEREECREFVGA